MKKLSEYEDNWTTDVGAWFQGERVVFRGEDLFNDLIDESWMSILMLGITGRKFSTNQLKLFEAIWSFCSSYPEPRIWNNRITSLAGSSRSTAALAIGAATSVSEASIYGRRPDIRSIDFLYRAKKLVDEGGDLLEIIKNELKQYRVIAGYGRPVINVDERIAPMVKIATDLGFNNGTYFKFAFEVEKVLSEGRWRMKMNVAALISALVADQGLSPYEHYLYAVLGFSAGMFPCYLDALAKPEGCFFPLRCESIEYTGTAPRKWDK